MGIDELYSWKIYEEALFKDRRLHPVSPLYRWVWGWPQLCVDIRHGRYLCLHHLLSACSTGKCMVMLERDVLYVLERILIVLKITVSLYVELANWFVEMLLFMNGFMHRMEYLRHSKWVMYTPGINGCKYWDFILLRQAYRFCMRCPLYGKCIVGEAPLPILSIKTRSFILIGEVTK